jgi:hypothetical protein
LMSHRQRFHHLGLVQRKRNTVHHQMKFPIRDQFLVHSHYSCDLQLLFVIRLQHYLERDCL